MKKNTRTSFRLVASLLAAFALASLLACPQPAMVSRKKAETPTTDTSSDYVPAAELPPFTLNYDGDKTVSLSPFQTLEASARSESARSLGGYDRDGVIALDGGTLDYFQWVFMDEAADGALYAYDDADGKSTQNLDL
jgi:hypothetical protein